jgi:hypothetical protein
MYFEGSGKKSLIDPSMDTLPLNEQNDLEYWVG